MNNEKMGFVDYLWIAFIFLLAMAAASCSKSNQLVDCNIDNIEIYANERCEQFTTSKETCKQEVTEIIKQTCGIS
jgi:hypothetical protein